MFAASKSGSVSEPTDSKFNYVTMLLHGNGTNGAQNNTFVDSSTNNFTITRNGNTTQGTFTPYGSNWSNYFGGSSGYLSFPNSSALELGTGSFTIEFWINGPLNNDKFILGSRGALSGSLHITTGGVSSTAGSLRVVTAAGTITSGTTLITDNLWHHCAIVRNGSTITLYVDGVSTATSSDSTNFSGTTGTWYVGKHDLTNGNYLNAYLSNLRIVKGTAVYTSAFTPPTVPLTAISGTGALICQSNYFKDNSSTNFTVTPFNDVSVQRFSPFSPTTAYSTSVIGGSGYFDGSGDYLGGPVNQTALQVGGGAYTIEFWVYLNSIGTTVYFYDTRKSSGFAGFCLIDTGSLQIGSHYSGSYQISITNPLKTGCWQHVALVRSGTGTNQLTLYVNGISVGTGTDSSSTSGYMNFSIGAYSDGNHGMNGYITDFRMVNGTAVYTSAFTPPTSPLTAVTNTSLLLNLTNAGILDNAMMNDLETVGNAQISTSVKKFGTGSMVFDAVDDRLVSASSPNIAFGTGDFTVEFWLNSNNVSSANQRGVIQTSDTAGGLKPGYTTGIAIYQGGNASGGALSGGVTAVVAGTFLGSSSAVITTGTWYHIALVRSSGTSTIYVNGTSVGSATTTGNCSGQNIVVGGYYDTTYLYSGYIDDLRITKGYARYTSNFTAPTAAFADKG